MPRTVVSLICLMALLAATASLSGPAGAQEAPPTPDATSPVEAATTTTTTATTSPPASSTTITTTTTAPAAPASPDPATDLPPGFTDGEPVGGVEVAPGDATADGDAGDAPSPQNRTMAATTRYFGVGPWNAIHLASAATSTCSGLSTDKLRALVVSPIFKESSAATRPDTAPSPMTLSRYDEWNGVYSNTSNQAANYGLYAFRDPYTRYARAYWHPGIGIWQYDSAGVGAPFDAVERMDVLTVAGDVASGMAARWCNPPTNVIGHGAPFTEQERRSAAWWPWWAGSPGCPLCQVEYDAMMGASPALSNVQTVSGITATGGAQQRTCSLAGQPGTVACWYIDPAVAEGAQGWTGSADGKNDPTVSPAPLSQPFYVLQRNGYEERHWLRGDTGYGIDISARRRMGKNARPRSNQDGSGLAWTDGSGLCDETLGRGACSDGAVPAPAGLRSTAVNVGGTYRTVTLDADGNGLTDVFWYAPGSAPDYIWLNRGSGDYTSVGVVANGTYPVVEAGDLDGDGVDDLLFHAPASGTSYVWRSRRDGTFSSARVRPGTGRVPLVGDFDGNGRNDIFWYAPGAVADSLWRWQGSGFTASPRSVGGAYTPFVGDFDGNGVDDIFWYAAGPAADYVWLHRRDGTHLDVRHGVGGTYQPVVGDLDGDRRDDIIWYAPGPAGDSVWFGGAYGQVANQSMAVTSRYRPVVADLGADGRDDVLWYGLGHDDHLWSRWTRARARTSTSLSLPSGYEPLAGKKSTGGDGVLWYGPGAAPDAIWWR